ncbi:A-factor-processing enzyme [Cyberlindnera fabianii]|uniref:A-factor-processing enzyme n=1 Tax=Cyberlindnera fabianii TaxID=36022 RepID=A0A1V2L4W8_CYBFA|nr:A-factor-processing enzyme [Cyberlindnera fabianii]
MTFHKSNNIEKPDLDNREYKFVKLPNDLTALLISDPKTDKSAAALDVNVGAFSDYEHLPGLAHFCEHLLFMGTKKYPSENEYSSFLSNHGGHSNAYTAAEDTNYYFEVNHQYLEGALDRFAQFFISPLFDPSCKDREIRAVDSENKKNLQNDTWRLYQLDKALSNPVHPYHKFSTGNLQTLGEIPTSQGIDTREELLKFYKDYYSSNLMKLAVIGREDLETLEKWVLEKFSDVANYNRPKPTFEGAVFTDKQLKKLIKAKPVMTKNKLSIAFVAPDHDLHWDVQSSHYYSHLLGHEGNGSILAYLKEKGWANGLSAGGYTISKGNGTFGVDIDLTEDGISHYEEILVVLFQYLNLLKREGAHQWIYNELQEVSEMNFKFKQKSSPSSTVSKLAKDMQQAQIPPEFLLSKTVMRKFDADLIKEYGEYLSLDNLRVSLISQSVETDKKEKWYGTDYAIDDLSPELCAKLANAGTNSSLYLPTKNDFIPTSFEVEKTDVAEPSKKPVLLKDTEQFRFWHKKDDQFWVPKAIVELFLNLPSVTATPYSTVMTSLYVDLVQDKLIDVSYNAEIAGLNFWMHTGKEGIILNIDGYNEKIDVLLKEVLKSLVSFEPKKERIDVIKEKTIRNLKNAGYKVPYQQITSVFLNLVNERTYDNEERLAALQNITFNDLQHFIPSIFKQAHVEGLIHGNIRTEEANQIAKVVEETLVDSKTLFGDQLSKPRTYLLPEGKTFRYDKFLPDEKNTNTCVQYFIQLAQVTDISAFALGDMVAQLIREPAFDTLRTKEQLGYIVFSGLVETRTTFGLRVLIQSERNAAYLESRIVNFLNQYKNILDEMTDEEFEKNKEALINKKLESLKNLGQENSRFTRAITCGYYDFLHNDVIADHLRKLTKSQVQKFYTEKVVHGSAKLIVNLHARASTDTEEVAGFPTGIAVESAGALKSQLYLTPAPMPAEEITPKNFGPKL